ncbi:hypothetical protein XCR1_1210002 [Xenorhabdus cabanillasii JM26]|uniref:Uncharacterized protein n=1 Tax=Xenorhabdus cabanillasii JM26 TaxID=1427517 RepID=W1IMM0_9GAMM|nr:hypothetical protein XCR1_1210002 [Xenorhabdus cabanillasii JM26]
MWIILEFNSLFCFDYILYKFMILMFFYNYIKIMEMVFDLFFILITLI